MEFIDHLKQIISDTRLFLFLLSFLCLLIELTNPGLFYFLSASSASFIVGIISLYISVSTTTQCVLFLGIFSVSFIILQRIVYSKYLYQKEQYKSHLVTLKHKEGIVISEISTHTPGQVHIKNEIWLAYPDKPNIKIEAGKKVIITGLQGAHIIVIEKE